ncbi:MAG: ABC transporter ATP-binding protein [Actinobacteria bacterium]|nr:ABC transporter ATP-binding protein [Actinomycetota bacterium]
MLPHRWPLIIGALLVIAVAVLDVAAPWPLKVVVDNVLSPDPEKSDPLLQLLGVDDLDQTGLIIFAIGALLLLTAMSGLATYGSSRILGSVGERVSATIRERVFTHLQRMSLSFHDKQRLGDLLTRTTTDVDYVQSLLVSMLSVFVPNVTILLFIAGICFIVDPAFALISLAVAPMLFGVVLFYRRRIKAASRRARAKDSEIASAVSETFGSVRIMQAYTSEARHHREFGRRNTARMKAGLDTVRLQSTLSPLVDVIMGIGTALVLGVGIGRVLAGTMSLGLLLVFLAYLKSLYAPMKALAKLTSVVSRGQASAERLYELLGTDPEIVSRPGALPLAPARGRIELRGVDFSYAPGQPTLHQVDLHVEPGQLIAITGPTGAGKSSIIGLIPRLYDVTGGRVLIDGVDVRDVTVPSLRRQISLVLQESVLFHGSIYDNIVYGADDVSPERVDAAVKAAHVDEFVSRLPDGYQTQVAERGVSLSGGQRQRIAIARALMRDTPIVILDEPTSGLDALSEQYVMNGLDSLMAGRTVVVIAHRLSTLRKADRIYVVDKGRIIEQGTHQELLRENGMYATLERLQHGDELDETSEGAPTADPEPLSDDPTAAVHTTSANADRALPMTHATRRSRRAGASATLLPVLAPLGRAAEPAHESELNR